MDCGLWTVDGCPYATICRATWDDADRILNQFGERLFNVLMIMRRIVLESSTIKKAHVDILSRL